MNLQEVQSLLATMQLCNQPVDGVGGATTLAAIDALFLARPYVQGDWKNWSSERRVAAAAQLFCMLDGIEVGAIDGLIGPQTRHAFDVWASRKRGVEGVENWRDQIAVGTKGSNSRCWPSQAHSEMQKFFGPVGANQTTLVLPDEYPMQLAWNQAQQVSRFSCHEKIHDAARRVLVRVLDAYGAARISELGLNRFGGCLNVRRMRGGSAWSTHAWGAALDFDPERNQLNWTRKRAQFARPEYERWWSLWEAEGFVSLGRASDFDWMHIQAAQP